MEKKEIIEQLNEVSLWITEMLNEEEQKQEHIQGMLKGIEKAIDTLSIEKIEVDIMYYHPDDNEDEKVYDFEGMAEEFENKLSELDDSVVVMCSVETN
jgi:sortase (surface protein transpeptidase)